MNNILPVLVVVALIALFTLLVVLAMALGGAGNDKVKCLQTVTNTYPNDSVYLVPDKSYYFIVVKKNGEVLLVKTMNLSDTAITSTDPLVKASVAASTEPTKVEK